jgi:glycosyltransferase involved in cell wall biosynthesis
MIPGDLAPAVSASYLKSVLPAADVTLATEYATALPVKLFGRGRLFYFMQHFEALFAVDNADPYVAETQALLTYHLGLEMIANSSWLKKKVEGEAPGAQVRLCLNAINHNVFFGEPRLTNHPNEVTVISHSGGGRRTWKGFREMVEAVAIARRSLPGVTIRWQVYGTPALLPPQNPVAPYEPLGFLQPSDLAQAYRKADVLLGASWYESFPLFPLEAMACGLGVVTTPEGTEDYAIHEQTAEIVYPKDPESIARGLIRVIRDAAYRFKIAKKGNEISRNFTWQKSVLTMEEILSKGQTGPRGVSKAVLAAPTCT